MNIILNDKITICTDEHNYILQTTVENYKKNKKRDTRVTEKYITKLEELFEKINRQDLIDIYKTKKFTV